VRLRRRQLNPATPSVSLTCTPPRKISAHGTAAVLDLRALRCARGWGPLAQEKERLPHALMMRRREAYLFHSERL
jgi:hypothetical protein